MNLYICQIIGMSRHFYWRHAFSEISVPQVPMAGLSMLARPVSTNGGTPPLSYSAYPASTNGGTPYPLSRHCHWRFKLPASVNGGTHVQKRPSLQFVLKETLFRKLFLKATPYSKFAT